MFGRPAANDDRAMNAFAAYAVANAVLAEPHPSHREPRVVAATGRRRSFGDRFAATFGSIARAVRGSDASDPATDLRFVRTTSAWDETVAPLTTSSAR